MMAFMRVSLFLKNVLIVFYDFNTLLFFHLKKIIVALKWDQCIEKMKCSNSQKDAVLHKIKTRLQKFIRNMYLFVIIIDKNIE